jgi:hypothetical protein
VRLDSSGELDPSFGGGDGVFRAAFGLRPTHGVPTDIPLEEIAFAELDAEGRAVMAIDKVGFPPSVGHTYAGWITAALARLTPSGDLDRNFGGGGLVEGIHGFCISTGNALVISTDAGLSRLREDGMADRAFGRNGLVPTRQGFGSLSCDRTGDILTLQGPESFLPTREDPSSWKVIKRSADGRLNRGFNGRAKLKLRGRYSLLTSIATDRRGRVLLAGTLRSPARNKRGLRSFFIVIRLLASGRPDRSFGHGGWVRTGFGPQTAVDVGEMAIDTNGRLLIAGKGSSPQIQPGGVVLARYLLGR